MQKKWLQHFKPNECKRHQYWSFKSKEKRNILLVNQPFSLRYWLMELRFGFAYQPVASKQENHFHLPQCTIQEPALPRPLPKVLWEKEVEVEPALSMTGSSGASSFSSPHSSTIIILWSTATVFQHCQQTSIRIFNIALTVKDTNTGVREMTTLKKILLMSHSLLI